MQAAIDSEQYDHGILALPSHDELARQNFVKAFKLHLATKVSPSNRAIYDNTVKPAFEKEHGRAPKDRHEVRAAMNGNSFYRTWSSLLRSSQEMMWSSCIGSVERQLENLIAKSKAKAKGVGAKGTGDNGGTLRLDPGLKIPAYHTAVDIHCMPGGYHTEYTEDDVAEGAVYDRAVYIYAMGRMGPFNDDIGASQVAHLKAAHPDFKPQRILDLGCAVGHSTVPFAEAYPEAEIYAVDVAAPMLRYAHARSESLGINVHFSQQNAEKMDFEDESFDLIFSSILIHETSGKAILNIMKECQRLLRPGGVVMHGETPPYKDMDEFDSFMLDWDTYNNNEPYWGRSHMIDVRQLAADTGFDPDKTFEVMAPSAFEAAKAIRTELFQGGDFGGGGVWYVYGCWK